MEQVIDIIYTLFIVRLCIRLTGMSKVARSVQAEKLILDMQHGLILAFKDIQPVLYRFGTTSMIVLGSKVEPSAEGFELHAGNFYVTHVPKGVGLTGKKVSQTATTESTFRSSVTRPNREIKKMAAAIAKCDVDDAQDMISSFLEKKLQDVLFGQANQDGKEGKPAAALFDQVPQDEFVYKTLPDDVSNFIKACTGACIESAQQQEDWTKAFAIGGGTLINACLHYTPKELEDVGIAAVIRALPKQPKRRLLMCRLGLAEKQIALRREAAPVHNAAPSTAAPLGPYHSADQCIYQPAATPEAAATARWNSPAGSPAGSPAPGRSRSYSRSKSPDVVISHEPHEPDFYDSLEIDVEHLWCTLSWDLDRVAQPQSNALAPEHTCTR
jgi:hypothetical protein